MECSVLCVIFILSAVNVMNVKSKVHVVAAEETLSIKVGNNIIAKMGKDGIELQKFKGSQESNTKELLGVNFDTGNKGIEHAGQEASENDYAVAEKVVRKEESRYEMNDECHLINIKILPSSDRLKLGLKDFIETSFTGRAFYATLFWIVFGE